MISPTISRSALADCNALVQDIHDLLDQYRTISLDQMRVAAKAVEDEAKAAGWMESLLADYLENIRMVPR